MNTAKEAAKMSRMLPRPEPLETTTSTRCCMSQAVTRFTPVSSLSLIHIFRCVRIGLYLGHDLLDDAVLAYDEGGADDAHADLAVILFFLPDAVGLYGLALRVGEQDEGQGILFRKLSV